MIIGMSEQDWNDIFESVDKQTAIKTWSSSSPLLALWYDNNKQTLLPVEPENLFQICELVAEHEGILLWRSDFEAIFMQSRNMNPWLMSEILEIDLTDD
jgi:hypothetical protein